MPHVNTPGHGAPRDPNRRRQKSADTFGIVVEPRMVGLIYFDGQQMKPTTALAKLDAIVTALQQQIAEARASGDGAAADLEDVLTARLSEAAKIRKLNGL